MNSNSIMTVLSDAAGTDRKIRQNENVSVVIPGMYDVREIDQNLEAVEEKLAGV